MLGVFVLRDCEALDDLAPPGISGEPSTGLRQPTQQKGGAYATDR